MEEDLVAMRPRQAGTRFELAARRIAEAWLRSGRVRASRADFRIARDFLERDGWKVEDVLGVRVRLTYRHLVAERTREEAVMVAFRRLVAPAEGQALALLDAAGRRPAPVSARVSLPITARAGTAGDACPAGSPA